MPEYHATRATMLGNGLTLRDLRALMAGDWSKLDDDTLVVLDTHNDEGGWYRHFEAVCYPEACEGDEVPTEWLCITFMPGVDYDTRDL